MMNQYQLQYAVDVLRYMRGDISPTEAMVEYVCERYADEIPYSTLTGDNETVDEWIVNRRLIAEDFGLTIEQVHEAEDELARLDAMERNDDPGDVGYLRRKDAMERA